MSDAVDGNPPQESDSVRRSRPAILTALLANVAVATAKLVAALVTGSSAMLAEAARSFADTGNQFNLLIGQHLGKRPPDREHPFGYGMERYFWTFMASIFMFVVGGSFSIFQGVNRLLHPAEVEYILINYVILGVAVVFESMAFTIAIRSLRPHIKRYGLWGAVRRTKDPTIFIVLFEDSSALIGIALAAVGLVLYQITGLSLFDALASLFIGALMVAVALILGYETRSLLLGEAASPETQNKIIRAITSVPEVESVLELLTMHLGPDEILVAVDLNLRDNLTTDQVEAVVDRIEEEIRKAVPLARRIFVECETVGRRVTRRAHAQAP